MDNTTNPMLGMIPQQQQQPDPLQQTAHSYQYYMSMNRPDLAQGVLKEANLPEVGTMDTIKSVLMGTPNSGLSGGAQLAQSAIPILMGLYKNYMSQQQWNNNPGVMQGIANGQMGSMQNNFGLNRQ